MQLYWTRPALDDLHNGGEYIARNNPAAAQRMAARIKESVEYLATHPNMGRPGRITGTRELVISGTPFIVVYRVNQGMVQMLRILHHAQKWPVSPAGD